MTCGARVGRAGRVAALAFAFVAVAAHAGAADPCATLAPSTARDDFAAVRRAFAASVRAEPERAIALACQASGAARDDGERLQARVDLASALHQSSRDDEAVAILDDVVATPGLAPRILGEAFLRRGAAWVVLRDMGRADADFARARVALADAGRLDDPLQAEVLMGAASAKQGALDLDGADRDLDEAAALLRRLGLERTREAADLINQRTMVAYARQDFAATVRHAEAELALTRSIGGPDDREQLDALATLGAIKSITGDFVGAEAALREGLRIADLRDDTSVDARLGLLQNLATFHLDRAEPAAALPYAQRALALATAHYRANAPALMRVYLTSASVYADLGRYPEAHDDYDRAAALDVTDGAAFPVLQRARLYLRRAQLDLKLGDLDGAQSDLERATRVMADRPKLDYWRGWQQRIACRLAAGAGDWRAADARCAQAIEYFAGVLDAGHRLILEALVRRCHAQTNGRFGGDACAAVEERLRTNAPTHRTMRVLMLDALAVREATGGRVDAALDLRVRMLAAASEIAAPDPLWAAQFALAESLASVRERRLAIFFAKQSVASIEAMRQSFTADRERMERGFLVDKLAVYRRLASWLLDDDRAPEALEVLRLLKREEVYDFAERPERAALDGRRAPIPMSEREVRLLERIARSVGAPPATDSDAIDRLARLGDEKRLAPLEAERLTQEISAAGRREDARAAQLRRFLADERAANGSRAAPNRVVPADRSDALARDEATAYFFVADDRLQFVFAQGGRIERRVVDVEPRVLIHAIGDYLALLSTPDDPRRSPAATDLYTWLGASLDRVARERGVRRVHLWLDGALRYVPFAALWDGRAYLVERYEFSYLVADDDARATPASAGTPSRALVAFGVTRALGGLPALPGVAVEMCGIVNGRVSGLGGEPLACATSGLATGALDGVGFANEYFTEDRLRTFASVRGGVEPHADLLHVGTHFALRPGNLKRSWLLMGDGSRLPLATFERLPFAGLDLVTISACQTGMAGAVDDDGREIEGLPAMLLARGVRSVVASLWRVDDRSTSTLMQTFYRALKERGVRVSDALRRAQVAMLGDRASTASQPYRWAAFVASTREP